MDTPLALLASSPAAWRVDNDAFFCRQVVPAGPPAGAGQSGSADQREQEEQSPGERSSDET